jgi:hypothetical protein
MHRSGWRTIKGDSLPAPVEDFLMSGHRTIALLASLLLPSLPAAATAAEDDVAENVRKLGHPRYAVREQAARDLDRAGAAALKALRAARDGQDEEIRRRAEGVARGIEARLLSESLLRAPRLRLSFDGVPLDKAIAEVAKKTGLPFTLDPKAGGNAKRAINLDTGEVPYWEAVEKFLAAAGLVEAADAGQPDVANPLGFQGGGQLRGVRQLRGGRQQAMYFGTPPRPVQQGYRLVEGQPTPVWTDGLVRVRALPREFPGNSVTKGSNEVTLTLEVTPAPALGWQALLATDVRRAVDDAGLPLVQSHMHHAPSGNPFNPYNEGFGQVVQVQQGQVIVWQQDGFDALIPAAPNPRHVTVTLLADRTPGKTLRTLEGTVTGQVLTAPQALLTVDDLLKLSVNKDVHGDGCNVRVTSRQTEPDGSVRMHLQISSPAGTTFANFPVNINGRQQVFLQFQSGPVQQGAPAIAFQGADGKVRNDVKLANVDTSSDGANQMWEYVVIVPAKGKAGPEPVKIVLSGQRNVSVNVPFVLKNVPLP